MSLWQLLKGGYGGGYGENIPERGRDDVGKLDPVLCAGRAKIGEMRESARRMGMTFAVNLLGIILDYSLFIGRMKISTDSKQEPRKLKFTNNKYRDQLEELCGFGITSKVSAGLLKHCSTYFAVPKTEELDRAIFNGKTLSSRFTTPDPVNIPDIPRVIEEINKIVGADEKGAHFLCGDLRHWFHQIPLLDQIRSWFGLATSAIAFGPFLQEQMNQEHRIIETFVHNTLPMGWSYSPLIAQSAAWTLLAHHTDQEPAYISLKDMTTPPMFVELHSAEGVKVGLATVYYDNYIVVSKCWDTIEAMSRRITRNADVFNITIKEHSLFHKKKLVRNNAQKKPPCTFLGIDFQLVAKAGSDCRQIHHLQWRVTEKDLPVICPIEKEKTFSPRQVARVIGRILYHRLVTLAPLGSVESTRRTLSLLRRVSSIGWKSSWERGKVLVSGTEADALSQEWAYVKDSPWCSSATGPVKVARVATDACDTGYAYVIFDDQGAVINQPKQKFFPPDVAGDHIFVKELLAAIEGICACQTLFPDVTHVHIITDNTAVAGVLKRMYSTNFKALGMLGRITARLRVATVASEDNAADAPSRGLAMIQTLTDRTFSAFSADDAGRRIGTARRHPNVVQNRAGIRHPEGYDDDLILDFISLEEAADHDDSEVVGE